MTTPTKKQKEILDFIALYTKKHGVSPTIEEMGRHFKRAVGTIHEHIEELIKKGFAKKNNYIRGIEIQSNSDLVEIPLKGYIAAGSPIEVFEQHETVTVPRTNLSGTGEHFALKVQGNSMIDEGIFNGDTVVIRKQNTANNGETIVAIINGNEATLKKIYKFQAGFRLQPANPEMKPIFVKNLLVQGKVVSVIRNFENNTNIEQISNNEEYIVSNEYSEKGMNLEQLTKELLNFRDIVIFKYGFHTKDDFLKTQIIDGLILQEIFKHIATTKKISTNIKTVNKILEELHLNDIEFTKDDTKLLSNILNKYNFNVCDDDVLGFIYQSIRPQSGRKEDGQYYTPKKVVKYILDNIKINLKENRDLKILDPACGSGQFLLEAYDILYNQYKAIGGKNEADIHHSIIKNHLAGFDIDKIAVHLTRLNLFLKSKGSYTDEFNILIADTLKRDSNLLESNKLDKYKNSIDFIVGNPPWGANLDEEQKKYYKKHYDIGRNGLNTFTLFIERAFDFLKESGKLGYLIPEAYLKIKVHQLSRLQILNRAKILLLGISGNIFQKVYAPCLVVIFQQEKNKTAREKNDISIENGVFNGHVEHRLILQKNFEKSTENIFNINQVGETEEILSHILAQKNYYLKDNALFILGIVTGNNKKYLVQEKKDRRYAPIIVGKDISKYQINRTGNYFIYDKSILQQIAPVEYYTVPEKIIYKFIGEKLSFAYDDKQNFTLNNANSFVPKIEKLKTMYILALLNSKLMQFFYNKSFFTVRVLRGNLEKLPLIYAEQEKQEKIINMVNQAMKSPDEKMFKTILNKIDDEVYSLYNINEGWRKYIEQEA